MILKIAISGYLIGALTFSVFAIFGTSGWDNAYFIWRSFFGQSLGSWYLLYKFSKQHELVAPMVGCSLIMFMWEIITSVTGIHVNNDWAVASFFIVLILITGTLIFVPQNRVVKFLIKHIP